jgi:hypothetical protein
MTTANNAIDEQQVIDLYTRDNLTMRQVAERLGTNHHRVKRILLARGVRITRKTGLRQFSPEHRQHISESCKGRETWNKGLTMPDDARRKNMRAKLGHSIDIDRYPDLERLKILTRLTSKHRKHFPTPESRQAFLDRFYFDHNFNAIYDAWIASGKDRWLYPSLDHMSPKANGGTFALDNLRFVTWFENRAKADMSLDEWETFKTNTHTVSDLFI